LIPSLVPAVGDGGYGAANVRWRDAATMHRDSLILWLERCQRYAVAATRAVVTCAARPRCTEVPYYTRCCTSGSEAAAG